MEGDGIPFSLKLQEKEYGKKLSRHLLVKLLSRSASPCFSIAYGKKERLVPWVFRDIH